MTTLAELRKGRGLSQAKLAELSGIRKLAIREIEQGKHASHYYRTAR